MPPLAVTFPRLQKGSHKAIRRGLSIISGLHSFLSDDPISNGWRRGMESS
ncbi:DUF1611 domain-containing protein [Thermococcus piezophilus]|nr:DUF1611 domain-containing protein [Thermococcus piezophilus]